MFELQSAVFLQIFRSAVKMLSSNYDRNFPPELTDFEYRLRIPCTQSKHGRILLHIRFLSHDWLSGNGLLFIPVERAFFPEIDVSHEQDRYIKQHFEKAEPAQLAKNVRPWIKKDCLDVKKNKDHCNQIELHGKRRARVTRWIHTAFVGLLLFAARPPPAYER